MATSGTSGRGKDRGAEGRALGELFSFISAQMLHGLWESGKGRGNLQGV